MTSDMRPVVSILVPVFNEAGNVDTAYRRIMAVMDGLADLYDYEILFTDNHSTDATFAKLSHIASENQKVRVLRFTRNFGFNRSLITAYRHAQGAVAIQIDCDMQDPPELVPEFLKAWENGHDLVLGVRDKRPEARWLIWLRKRFYRFLNSISDDFLPEDAGDFRLVDRPILDVLQRIDDHSPYVRGITASLAKNIARLPYERAERTEDQSKFPMVKLISMAVDGICSNSIVPLRLATYIGLVSCVVIFCLVIYYLIQIFLFGAQWLNGLPTILLLLLLGIALNAVFLGVLGEYVGRIYLQLRRRPTVVVEKSLNLRPRDWDQQDDVAPRIETVKH